MTIGIGFEVLRGSGTAWRGGAIHFANWMHALRLNFSSEAHLFLVEASHGTAAPSELVPLVERVIDYPTLKRYSPDWALNHLRHRLFKRALEPDRVLYAQGVNVLVCGVLERRTNLPTLALLTDFQHRHLPEYFDATEIAWRDAEYSKTAARATRLLVSGESVRADVEEFTPAFAGKVRIVAPVSYIPDEIYARPPAEIVELYSLPGKFIYLPNQFWRHKNHLFAFDAVRRLRAHGELVSVVCTGYGNDSRSHHYFSEILQTISSWGIRDQIILLGNVPREHVFALIRQAAFVLNPSRFEGYGLSLDEARSIGKRALVSDLPAHREQNAPCVEYFSPTDIDDLVEKMSAQWAVAREGPDEALEAHAHREQPGRLHASALRLMDVIRQVIE